MAKRPSPKRQNRRHVTHRDATIKVCGRVVSRRWNLICHLPPSIKHETHAAIAVTDQEIYLVTRLNNQVFILGGEQWQEVEDHNV